MRKFFFFIYFLCAGLLSSLHAQQIDRFEYFFNTDPGVGNGTAITPPAADSVTISLPFDITTLSPGYHKAGLRARYDNGIWSHTEFRSLYITTVTPNTNTAVTRKEYFLDTDPGNGNGTAVNFSAADSVTSSFMVDITSVPAGYHKIGIRTLNTSGIWSHTEFRFLYINPPPDLSNQQITAAEFYFGDTDPGLGNAAAIPITNPADSITILHDSILNNLPQGNYKINLRFRDARGVWSHQETRQFAVCSTYGAQSEFTYQIEGNQVFFTNNSLYQDTVSWKFGDNTIDTVLNPIKTYTNAGIYNVDLITGNTCGIDTLRQTIEIRGLQRVNANRAGNAGISTLMFEGFGFTSLTDVKLILGAQVFLPVTKTFVSNRRIRAYFDLTGFTPGVYRAMATLGSNFDTLNNALTIEEALPPNLTLTVADGRAFSRPGRMQIMSTVKNNGSHDAVMVPYVNTTNIVPGLAPVNMIPFVYNEQVPILNEGVFQQTYQYLSANNVPPDVMFFNALDTARNSQIVAYYQTRVPGHASVPQRVGFPHPGATTYSYQTGAVILGPMLDSYALLDSVNTDYQPCYSAFLKQAVEKELNIAINDAAWNSCFANAFDTLTQTLANIAQNPLYENMVVPMQAGFSALLSQMNGCGGVPVNLGGIQFKRVIQNIMYNWIYLEDIDSLDNDCIDTTVKIYARKVNNLTGVTASANQRTEATACDNECTGATVFPELCDQCLPLIMAGKVGGKLKVNGHAWAANSAVKGCQEWCETTSVDPNAKYGPGNNGDRKYINHTKSVDFKITFENLATATAPAAYVEIRDTIDKAVFDIKTLQLGVFSWGDSLVACDPNEQNVSILKNIKPVHPNFLRIDATTDTAKGIVVWKFWTVDTVTLQLTNEPFEGFLPPNTDGVTGAGYVTFSIAPQPTVTNGTILKNKATIIFDENPDITTDEWEYRIDTLQPSSAVNSLPAITNTTSFNVSWGGTDAHSGINRYSVYVSVNDSAYKVWLLLTDQTSDNFSGQFGNTYKFFSVALDKAGNYEDPPDDVMNNPDAYTMVDAPLPLDLLSFTAQKSADQQKVNLTWVTVNEQDVAYFDLERSADGITYRTIARIPATNNPSGYTYTWQDVSPLPKINYYRLRMTDIDATYKYSPVRLIKFAAADDVLIFPTVASDRVFIQSENTVTVLLYNTNGQLLQSHIVRGNHGMNISNYATGIYYIRIPEANKTFKILKQ